MNPSGKNHPWEDRLMNAVYELLDAMDGWQEAHGDDCDCYLCFDIRGAGWGVSLIKNWLESELWDTPAMLERARKRRLCRDAGDAEPEPEPAPAADPEPSALTVIGKKSNPFAPAGDW